MPVEFPIALQWEFILTDVPAAAAAARAQLADGHPKVIMISNRFFIFITYVLYIYRGRNNCMHAQNTVRTCII